MKLDINLTIHGAIGKLEEILSLDFQEHRLLAVQKRNEFLITDFEALKKEIQPIFQTKYLVIVKSFVCSPTKK